MAERCVLLVGEGNFSFAAALCGAVGGRVVATCYEREEEVAARRRAAESIRRLRERGAWAPCRGAPRVPCAEVLTQDGEVCVALCRGQGGTPADQPRREWHNSWQVVAVAAGAGFILSDVHPFRAEAAHGYECTGYRGFLELNSNHPVRTIKEKLTAVLSQAFPLQSIDYCLSLLLQGCLSAGCHSNIFWVLLSPEETPSAEEMASGQANAILFSHVDFHEDTDENVQGRCQTPKQCYLRPSLLPYAQAVIKSAAFVPGTLYVFSGPVFRKCLVSPYCMPVFHEMIFVCAVSRGSENSCIQMVVDKIKTSIHSLHQSISDSKLSISLQEAASMETAELSDFTAFESQLGKIQFFLCMKTDTQDSSEKGFCVGVVRTARYEPADNDLVVVFASVNLDLVAMLICAIDDWRMLWTSDARFLRQFPAGELRLFKSFSLYPPSYVHDVSFWLPDGEQFDDVAFHTIAREVSGEAVACIHLLDSFQQPGTGRNSVCCRLTFQSCDRALSRGEVAAMQLRFREEISQRLRVALR
ncbi:hypothetical protein ASZ78_007654 [Callipepla squamata]|uniref:phenylalanine--tRNA ligase n=1 Tax=Callipepla squamata TaxID=9009 RepID=A0A226MUM1_CALSU|nr:hypothetical protein ASZ78_007654 [Callipepla squamata]